MGARLTIWMIIPCILALAATDLWAQNASGAPTISVASGTIFDEDNELTASIDGITDPDGIDATTIAWQWKQSGGYSHYSNGVATDIRGATSNTFTPLQKHVGEFISVCVSFDDNAGNREGEICSARNKIANVNDHVATGKPIVVARGHPGIKVTSPMQGVQYTIGKGSIADDDGVDDIADEDGVPYLIAQSFQRSAAASGAAWTESYFGFEAYQITSDDADSGYVRACAYFVDKGHPLYSFMSRDPHYYAERFEGGDLNARTTASTLCTDGLPVVRASANASGAPTVSVASGTIFDEGNELTASIGGITDPDGIDVATIAWQWRRAASASGPHTDMVDATASTFTPLQEHVGLHISVCASFEDNDGTDEGPLCSAPGQIASTKDEPTGGPVMVKRDQPDTEVTSLMEGVWYTTNNDAIEDDNGILTSTMLWSFQRSTAASGAAWSESYFGFNPYQINRDDVNAGYVRACVFYIDASHAGADYHYHAGLFEGGQLHSAAVRTTTATLCTDGLSTSDNPEQAANATGAPSVSAATGTAYDEDNELTAGTSGITDPDGIDAATIAWQWRKADQHAAGPTMPGTFTDIAGATSSTFTPLQEHVGQWIQVCVSFMDLNVLSDGVTPDPQAEGPLCSVAAQVRNVNDAPTSMDIEMSLPANLAENYHRWYFGCRQFPFADEDGDSMNNLTIVSLPDKGTLQLWGEDVVPGRRIDWVKWCLEWVVSPISYHVEDGTPPPTDNYTSFTFKVGDGKASSEVHTMTIKLVPRPRAQGPAIGRPTVSGTAEKDSELTAAIGTVKDPNGIKESTIAWQWRQSATETGTYTDISGATSATFTPLQEHVGQYISACVSFDDNDGNSEGPLCSTPGQVVNVGAVVAGKPSMLKLLTSGHPFRATPVARMAEGDWYVTTVTDGSIVDEDGFLPDSRLYSQYTRWSFQRSTAASGAAWTESEFVDDGYLVRQEDVDSGYMRACVFYIDASHIDALGAHPNLYGHLYKGGDIVTAATRVNTATLCTEGLPVDNTNDSPVAIDNDVIISADAASSGHRFNAGDFSFTDADGDSLAAVEILSLPGRGTLQVGGGDAFAGQVVAADDIDTIRYMPGVVSEDIRNYAAFQFRVADDDSGIADDAVAANISLHIYTRPADGTLKAMDITRHGWGNIPASVFTDSLVAPAGAKDKLNSVTITAVPPVCGQFIHHISVRGACHGYIHLMDAPWEKSYSEATSGVRVSAGDSLALNPDGKSFVGGHLAFAPMSNRSFTTLQFTLHDSDGNVSNTATLTLIERGYTATGKPTMIEIMPRPGLPEGGRVPTGQYFQEYANAPPPGANGRRRSRPGPHFQEYDNSIQVPVISMVEGKYYRTTVTDGSIVDENGLPFTHIAGGSPMSGRFVKWSFQRSTAASGAEWVESGYIDDGDRGYIDDSERGYLVTRDDVNAGYMRACVFFIANYISSSRSQRWKGGDMTDATTRVNTATVCTDALPVADADEISVADGNNRPASTDAEVDVFYDADADNPFTFSASDFPFYDGGGGTLASVTIVTTTATTAGTFTADGVPVTDNTTIQAADIGNLAFYPSADEDFKEVWYWSNYARFTFSISNGTAQSGIVHTMIINVRYPEGQFPAMGKPSIDGDGKISEQNVTMISVTGTLFDVNGLDPHSVNWQWQQADSADGVFTDINEDDADIFMPVQDSWSGGIVASTFTPTQAQLRKHTRICITFMDKYDPPNKEGPLCSDPVSVATPSPSQDISQKQMRQAAAALGVAAVTNAANAIGSAISGAIAGGTMGGAGGANVPTGPGFDVSMGGTSMAGITQRLQKPGAMAMSAASGRDNAQMPATIATEDQRAWFLGTNSTWEYNAAYNASDNSAVNVASRLRAMANGDLAMNYDAGGTTGWRFWARHQRLDISGTPSRNDATSDIMAYRGQSTGLYTGADRSLGRDARIGIALGMDDAEISADLEADGTDDSINRTASSIYPYLRLSFGGSSELRLIAGIGNGEMKIKSSANGGETGVADLDWRMLAASITRSSSMIGPLGISYSGSLQYSDSETSSAPFASGADLQASASDSGEAAFSTEFSYSGSTLRPFVNATARKWFGDLKQAMAYDLGAGIDANMGPVTLHLAATRQVNETTHKRDSLSMDINIDPNIMGITTSFGNRWDSITGRAQWTNTLSWNRRSTRVSLHTSPHDWKLRAMLRW